MLFSLFDDVFRLANPVHMREHLDRDLRGPLGNSRFNCRDDFGASQGAKSAHTGSMEAMSNAGAVPKRLGPTGRPTHLHQERLDTDEKTRTKERSMMGDHERCSDRSIFSINSRLDWHSTHRRAKGNA